MLCRIFRITPVVFAALLLMPLALPQNDAGVVAFANSGSPRAQAAFLHGLAQLHNFEYEAARADFKTAQGIDPNFAMAYWGEAMTWNYPVWIDQDRAAARSALERLGATPGARLDKAPTEREKDYLRTVDLLYGEGEKRDRDARYADAMESLHRKYPDDVDAAAFYALALLGTAEGVRDERTYMRAAAILLPLFYKYPHHPGVAHYLIHSCDDPVHAPLALPAAEAYAKIAPGAAHAQHMTSHIFLALGMWNDVIRANEAAVAVGNRMRAAHEKNPNHCGHYDYWLEYGYLETGRLDQAKQIVEGCREQASQTDAIAKARDVADPDDAALLSYLEMQTRYVIDTQGWNSDVAGLSVEVGDVPMARFARDLLHGFIAVGRGDAAEARKSLAQMSALTASLVDVFDKAGVAPDDPARRVPGIEVKQLEAIILAAEGNADKGIARAREAAADESGLPYAFGPPDPVKPSYELLGELLLKQNRTAEAETAFRQALVRAPNRVQTTRALHVPGTPNAPGASPSR